MKRLYLNNLHIFIASLLFVAFSGCKKDPYKGVVSNERSIEAFSLGERVVQVGPAQVDRASGTVKVRVLLQEDTDLSQITPIIQQSYRATVSPASGETVDFAANENQYTYTVTAESGLSREWTVELEPFEETILGVFTVQGLVVYGGTGPEYGGGAVLNMTDKPWIWPEQGGPAAELDNTLRFEFAGVTETGNTYGTFHNDAGADGLYADFSFIADPKTDVNHFYRKLPQGEGTWERDYTANTVTFTFADGRTTAGVFLDAGSEDLGNSLNKQIVDYSLAFELQGTDDWEAIYSDYDKFVRKPRKFWIDMKKIN